MKVINGWLFLLLVFLSGRTYAQIKPIERGTKVPDIDLGYVWNNPGKHYRMSDLKGRMVILDFWFTRCSGCVAGFPKMRELQAKFGDKVMIFLVTYESKENVEKMIRKGLVDLSGMTVITGDTVLTKLFPPYSYPYHVWIDKEGIFRYGTFGFNTTEKNISHFLADGKVNIGEMKFRKRNDRINSLLEILGTYPQFIDNYSIMLKGQYEHFEEGIGGGLEIDSSTGFPRRFQALGQSPLELLQSAFSEDLFANQPTLFTRTTKSRLVLELKDSNNLYQPLNEDKLDNWKKENFLMYEVKINATSANALYEKMKLDLNHSLPIYGKIELRPVRHLALIRTDSVDRFRSFCKKKHPYDIEWTTGSIEYNDAAISSVIFSINLLNSDYLLNSGNHAEHLPVIDNTGIDYKVSLKMPMEEKDRLLFLRRNGFDLVERTDSIPMLIVRDR